MKHEFRWRIFIDTSCPRNINRYSERESPHYVTCPLLESVTFETLTAFPPCRSLEPTRGRRHCKSTQRQDPPFVETLHEPRSGGAHRRSPTLQTWFTFLSPGCHFKLRETRQFQIRLRVSIHFKAQKLHHIPSSPQMRLKPAVPPCQTVHLPSCDMHQMLNVIGFRKRERERAPPLSSLPQGQQVQPLGPRRRQRALPWPPPSGLRRRAVPRRQQAPRALPPQ